MYKKSLIIILCTIIAACSENADNIQNDIEPHDIIKTLQTENVTHHSSHDEANSKKPIRENTSSDTRSAQAHSHGDAELAIVIEGNVVTVELESPLYNLLGFEHHPETSAQKAKVEMAERHLQKGEDLFVFNSNAKCNLMSENKAVVLFEDDEDHDDEEHHDEDEGSHKDVLLQYQYRCAKAASLSNVSVNLFELFEDMSDIDVTYLGPSTQKQVSLTRKNTQMDLSQ